MGHLLGGMKNDILGCETLLTACGSEKSGTSLTVSARAMTAAEAEASARSTRVGYVASRREYLEEKKKVLFCED